MAYGQYQQFNPYGNYSQPQNYMPQPNYSQRLQQMEQTNPHLANPQYAQQPQQAQQGIIKGCPVTGIDEVKGVMLNDNSLYVFTDIANEKIHTKQIGPDGKSIVNSYVLQKQPRQSVEQPKDIQEIIKPLQKKIEELEERINELKSNATNNDVPKQPKSNANNNANAGK